MMSDSGSELESLYRQVAAGEPALLRASYLAIPGSGVMADGSTVPFLAQPFEVRPSGLAVPARTPGQRLSGLGRRYLTARELLDYPVPPERVFALVGVHQTEHVLGACGALMAALYETNPASEKSQRDLAGRFCIGLARDRALAAIADDWVFLSPQIVMAVAKLAVLTQPDETQAPPEATDGHVVEACLGLAQFLGAPEEDDGSRWWGTLAESLALELVQNQHFNNTTNVGTLLGRFWRTREIAAQRRPSETQYFDKLFAEATGTTPAVLFDVGLTVYMSIGESTVRFARSRFDQLAHPAAHVDAALRLLAADEATLRAETAAELHRVGFDWAFNVFRRYPMLQADDGTFVCLHPRFLLDRITGTGQFWEVRAELGRRHALGGSVRNQADKDAGAFEDHMGHVAEDYAGDGATVLAGEGPTRHLWTEGDLEALWPDASCCDFLIDAGPAWIAIEVISRRLKEQAAAGASIKALEAEFDLIVDEKAKQLDATIRRLIENAGSLPENPARAVVAHYHPIVLATSGFPWNPITAAAVHGRLREANILQHPLIHPLTVLGLDELEEEIESAVDRGTTTLLGLLDARAAANMTDWPIDAYLSSEGHGLARPARLDEPMHNCFRQTARALGLDPAHIESAA